LQSAEPLYIFVSHDGMQLKVSSWDDVLGWLSKEEERWAWLTNRNDFIGGVGQQFRGQLLQMRESCQININRGENFHIASQIFDQFRQPTILCSDSLDGKLVFDILNDFGDVEAAAAAAFLTKTASPSQADTARSLRGMILVAMPNMQSATQIEVRLRNERANFRSNLRTAIEESANANETRTEEFARSLLRARRLALKLITRQRDKDSERSQNYEIGFNAAMHSFLETERTFKEYMKLRGPVEYWEKKAQDHALNKVNAFKNLRRYFIALGIFLGLLFVCAGFLIHNISLSINQNPLALYLVISGGLAIFSTIGFWFARLLTRLYLSEHHLQTDAEEREVMARTFLALFNEGVAGDADKQVILNALFRATQDGIIRDDGPQDIAIQTLITKIASGGRI
jgi:hypothetical protein